MKFSVLLLSAVVSLGLPVLALSQAIEDGPPAVDEAARPGALVPLYVALAAAQALDVHSSRLAISRGAHEMNSVVRDSLTNRPWAAVAIKAGVTAGMLVASERLWRRKRRTGAVVLMAVVAAMQFGVDVHNYRVAAQLR